MTSVIIPVKSALTEIEYGAFRDCTSLASVTIPESVTTIEESTFKGCTSLASISIPESVTTIGFEAFRDCSNLSSVIIPKRVTKIGWNAFFGCTSLSEVIIPDSVTIIDGGAFNSCKSLVNITIPNSVTEIGVTAFSGCTSLTSITIPDKVTEIGWAVFHGCTSLNSVTIPDSVTTIGKQAFKGCNSLMSITIPDSVASIESEAFDYYYNRDHIPFEDNLNETNITIICNEGSYAQEYAIEYGKRYDLTTGHQIGDWQEKTSPSCESTGLRVRCCETCKDVLEEEVIPATGHEMSKWQIEYSPSCDMEGLEFRYCDNCWFREERIIPATEEHLWDKGEITKQPSTAQTGIKTFTCLVCHTERTEIIPVIVNTKGKDGTALGEGASAELAEKAITAMKSDTDPKGSTFGKLQLKSTVQTKNSVKLQWKKVKGAKKYVIYGNASGKKNKMKKLATVKGIVNNFKKIAGKKVKKGTYYKFIVVAIDGNNRVVSSSKLIHVATKGGKVGNPKSLIVKAKVGKKVKAVGKVTVKKGKSLKLRVTVKPFSKKLKVKKHVAPRYESSNTKIATVNAKGVIKAKKKGSCKIYVYAQNGILKQVSVTVK